MSERRRARRVPFGVQLPWKRDGWYSDQYRESRDPELDKKVEAAGNGVNPYGYLEDRPGLAINPAAHNPYVNVVMAGGMTWCGVFLFGKLAEVLWAAILVGGFFWLSALIVVGVAVWRIPGWHRARRIAREHVARTGGAFPNELKWFH